ncbi:MAG TPA: hypothetical protein VKY85_00280, partial [Candidatus Angelobacter sp.]|nr:hypothetical protein [Candidatus Angelobacter sp.]
VNLASGALPTLLESSGTPAHPGTGFGVSDDPMTLSGPGGELAQPKECTDDPILVTQQPFKVTPQKSEIARNAAAARPAVAGYGVTHPPAFPGSGRQNEAPIDEESRDQVW